MRRVPLLILGFVFIGLCVACLFTPDRSSNMLVALIVQLVFFMRFAMVKRIRTSIKTPESIVNSQHIHQKQKKYEANLAESEVQVINS
jgi:UDP-N-acetylmuramyl pentapeptide phosphotransferase/UDP-N-acetylglucosamine-1-phosphate transferase